MCWFLSRRGITKLKWSKSVYNTTCKKNLWITCFCWPYSENIVQSRASIYERARNMNSPIIDKKFVIELKWTFKQCLMTKGTQMQWCALVYSSFGWGIYFYTIKILSWVHIYSSSLLHNQKTRVHFPSIVDHPSSNVHTILQANCKHYDVTIFKKVIHNEATCRNNSLDYKTKRLFLRFFLSSMHNIIH